MVTDIEEKEITKSEIEGGTTIETIEKL